MNFQEFQKSLTDNEPSGNFSPLLVALWHDGRGDWKSSHNIVQDIETKEAAWVHAYLHRKEGDDANARYWYARAGKKFPKFDLKQEWREIVDELLNQ
ncbi:MAG: hypothetical protein KA713_12615 [Chryseotalea sp. WA131a]|jgi:hypothetical protein|nr:MAG: hypothetical protein KA713_12615 [Chryseotalea sp. WA131a]